jgi:hypothetical protein
MKPSRLDEKLGARVLLAGRMEQEREAKPAFKRHV